MPLRRALEGIASSTGRLRSFAGRLAQPALLLLLALVLGAAEIHEPPGLDQGILAYIGSDILDGGVPYLTSWDHKPPGSYYLYALGLLLFGRSVEAIRVFDLAYMYLLALASSWLTAQLFNRLAGFFAGAILLVTYYTRLSWWDKSQPDEYMLLPMLVCLGLATKAVAGRRVSHEAVAGLCLGWAFITKLVAAVAIVPVLCWWLWEWAGTRRTKQLARALLCLSLGFLLINAGLAWYLELEHALHNFIESQLVFNRGYVLHGYRGEPSRIFALFKELRPDLAVILTVVAMAPFLVPLGWMTGLRRRLGLTWRGVLFTTLLLACLACEIIAQAKYYPYHFIPLLVPLSMLAGVGLYALHQLVTGLFATGSRARRWVPIVVSAVLLAGTIAPFQRSQADKYATLARFLNGTVDRNAYYTGFGGYGDGGGFSYLACSQAADYIRAHTRPDERIYIWGFDPLLPFLAQRKLSTRFTYNTPLIVPWRLPRWRYELLAELEKAPPAYVVFLRNDQHPWTTGRDSDSYDVMREDFPELRRFISTKYRLETSIEDYRILRLRGPKRRRQ